MNLALIRAQIGSLQNAIARATHERQFADGMAYTQDGDRIRAMQQELKEWREILEVCSEKR